MKKSNLWLGIPAITLIFGMAVLGACSSSPKTYSVIDQVMPDDQSAVVYFWGSSGFKAIIWDGETPIGDFGEGPFLANMAWKTTPGEHYFLANTFNWITMKANLEPNKRYFVQVMSLPNPVPFAKDMVALRVLNQVAGEELIKQGKIVLFTDGWRTKFLQDKRGKRLQEAQEQLQKARNDTSMEITLR